MLRSKYNVYEVCPSTIGRPICSYVWRSLTKVWNLFRERVTWSVGNGSVVSFIQDDWIPSLGPLQKYLINGISIPRHATVSQFATANEGWNWAALNECFPKEVLACIAACHVPNEALGNDLCLWKLNTNGRFTVKSAYSNLDTESNAAVLDGWDMIWKNPLPPRVKHFLRLVRHYMYSVIVNSPRQFG